jgi:hypothetical protein
VGVFDRIDRQFRPQEPIKLECQGEEHRDDAPGSINITRRASMFMPHLSEVLCERCWGMWAPWSKPAS